MATGPVSESPERRQKKPVQSTVRKREPSPSSSSYDSESQSSEEEKEIGQFMAVQRYKKQKPLTLKPEMI